MKSQEDTIASLPPRRTGTIIKKFKTINLQTNSYLIKSPFIQNIHIFYIQVTPAITYTNHHALHQLLQTMMPQIQAFIPNPIRLDNYIYSCKQPTMKNFSLNSKDNKYIVMVKQIKCFNVSQEPQIFIGLLNNGLRVLMDKLGYTKVGRSKKFIKNTERIDMNQIYLYSGFKASFYNLETGIYLKAIQQTKIVRNQTVLQAINHIYKLNDHLDKYQKRQILQNLLIGQIIMTNYGKARYLYIQNIIFEDLKTIIVQHENMTIPQYYQYKYNIRIRNLKQPLIETNCKCSHLRTLLVPELCFMTGIPQYFDENNMKEISKRLSKSIDSRRQEIREFVGELDKVKEQSYLSKLGIQISSQNTKIQGKIIPPPTIQLGDGRQIPSGKQFSFSIHNTPLYKNDIPIKLALILVNSTDAKNIIDYFKESCQPLKIQLKLSVSKIDQLQQRKIITAIEILAEKAKQINQCNLCLVVLPWKYKGMYGKVKIAALKTIQINSQVVLESTLRKKNLKSVALKILLQIAAKSGNVIWSTCPKHKKIKTLVIGFSTTLRVKVKASYTLAMCATYDENYSQFFSMFRTFTEKNDIFQKMKELILQALVNYMKINKYIPEDIVILQKFQSHTIYEGINDFLISPLVNDLQQKYDEKRPKIVYVHLNLNQRDRFFCYNGEKYINVPSGTLIDSVVTEKNTDQFFLTSQTTSLNQGYTLSSCYTVLYCDSQTQKGMLETLIHSLCFGYANWNGPIKLPNVLQYTVKMLKFDESVLNGTQLIEQFRKKLYYI